VNVAEDVADAGSIEDDSTRASGLVQTKIEALAFEQGKDIVKERIVIRKLDLRTGLNDQQVGREALVMLDELLPVRFGGRYSVSRFCQRNQPNHATRKVRVAGWAAARQLDLP
jgi:hypothetical protein